MDVEGGGCDDGGNVIQWEGALSVLLEYECVCVCVCVCVCAIIDCV